MIRLTMLAAVGSLFVVTGSALAAEPGAAGGACAGEWKIEFQTPMGNQAVPMQLAQSGEQITGKATDPNSGDDAEVKGTCKDDVMTLSQTAQSPMGPIELNFTGKVSGNNVTGTIKFGTMGEGEFIGTKQ